MLLTIPSIGLMSLQLRLENNKRIVALGQRSIGIICMALAAWVNDRFFCSYWAGVGFPYLHGVWHILIFLSSYSSIVLFAYCDVVNHMPDKTPILKYLRVYQDAISVSNNIFRYFHCDKFELGVPYVFVTDKLNLSDNLKSETPKIE